MIQEYGVRGEFLKNLATILLLHPFLWEVNSIATPLLIPGHQRAPQKFQIRNENDLSVFFYPKLYPYVKDLHFPQQIPGRNIFGNHVFISAVAIR